LHKINQDSGIFPLLKNICPPNSPGKFNSPENFPDKTSLGKSPRPPGKFSQYIRMSSQREIKTNKKYY